VRYTYPAGLGNEDSVTKTIGNVRRLRKVEKTLKAISERPVPGSDGSGVSANLALGGVTGGSIIPTAFGWKPCQAIGAVSASARGHIVAKGI
jgi:hypothetical protein